MSMAKRARTLPLALLWVPAALGVLALALHAAMMFRFTVDDAYITLRYSQNVARGAGAVYNTIGPRAEGYTSFLWMLLLAIPHVIRANALVAAKALGVALTFSTTLLVGLWASLEVRDVRGRALGASAAILAYAALPRTAVHAVTGMETALYTVLLTGTLFAASRVVLAGVKWTLPFALLGLAAALTRPEACLGVGVASLAVIALVPRADRVKAFVTIALACGVPVVGYELFRLSYYGLPLPLPFYVKVASPGALPGTEPVVTWLASDLRFVVPLAVFFVALPRHFRPVLAAVLALATFFLLPQHLMGYSSRYLAPLDPALAVCFGVGVAALAGEGGPAFIVSRPFLRAPLVVGSLVLPLAVAMREAPAEFGEHLAYADGLTEGHERLGRELAALNLPDARLALSDAGAVPYLSGWWTLDLLGLNDAHIAVTGSHDPDFVLSQSPDVLVLISTSTERFVPDVWNTFEGPLYEAATAAGYARVRMRRFADDYWLWVFARPTGAAGARLSVTGAMDTESAAARNE